MNKVSLSIYLTQKKSKHKNSLILFHSKFDLDEGEEEENILNMEALNKLNTIKNVKNIQEVKHEEILESTTDANEWKLEVERVLPQLKVTIKTDHKVPKPIFI